MFKGENELILLMWCYEATGTFLVLFILWILIIDLKSIDLLICNLQIIIVMASSFEELQSKGWERLEVFEKGIKKTYYKTPPHNGVQKVIRRSGDLRACDKHYAGILFPSSSTVKRNNKDPNDSTNIKALRTSIDIERSEPSTSDSSMIVNKIAKENQNLAKCADKLFPKDRDFSKDLSECIPEYIKKT